MRDQSFASPDDIDLTALWATLRRAAPKLIGISIAAGILTYVVLSMMAPRYDSQAELAIVAKGAANPFTNPNNAGSGMDTLPARMDREAVNTHIRSILSSNLAAKVAGELDLKSRPEFNSALGPVDTLDAAFYAVGLKGGVTKASTDDAVLNEFFSKLDVFSPTESRIINIRFTSVDPELAANAANALAEAYREKLANTTVSETDSVQKLLAPKIAELSKEVSKADSEVASFRAKAGLLRSGAGQTPINEQQLGEIASEVTRARAATSAAETRAKAARQLLTKGTPEVIPEVQASPIIQNLIQQRVTVDRDLLKLSATMKPAHPVIRQLNADLEAVKRQISSEVENLVAGLERQAFTAAQQEAEVRKSLDEVKATITASGGDRAELRRLETEAAAKRGELERLQAQYEANRVRADRGIVPVEAQIITMARPSTVPAFPRKLPYTILVMAGVLLLGTAIVVTAGLAAGARPGAAAGRMLAEDIPVLATTAPPPREPDPSSPPPGTRSGPELPRTIEAIPVFNSPAALASHLAGSAASARMGLRTMLASDAEPAATAEAARRICIALTGSGAQTLLIDAGIDGSSLADELGTPRVPGLTELLAGTASFSDVVCCLPGTDAHVIASGAASSEGLSGLDPDQLNMILDALDEAYDQIIVVALTGAARSLFETIQGRFDMGVTIEAAGRPSTARRNNPGTYLGFDVSDIELLRLEIKPEFAGSTGTETQRAAARGSARVA